MGVALFVPSNKEVIITKNGKPISHLLTFKKKRDTFWGLHKTIIKSHDDFGKLFNPPFLIHII